MSGQLAPFLAAPRDHRLLVQHELGNRGIAVTADVEVLVGSPRRGSDARPLNFLGVRVEPMQGEVALHHGVHRVENRLILRVILVGVKGHSGGSPWARRPLKS